MRVKVTFLQKGKNIKHAERLLFKRNYENSLGVNARERAIARHDPDKIVNEVLNIYSSVLSKKTK